MNDQRPAMPSLPNAAPSSGKHRGTRLTASLLLLLGFGFTATALIETPHPPADIGRAPAVQVVTNGPAGFPGAGEVDHPEVAAAVRNWVWETPSQGRPASSIQDVEELWLAR